MTSFAPVNSVGRALRVLQIVNSSGPLRIGELASQAKLPKPTAVRLVDTLVTLGFVQKESVSKTYFVTQSVRSLSIGAERSEIISEACRPAIMELTEDTKWPAAVATLDGCNVFVCATTRHESKMSLHYSSRQSHLSLTCHALGRAYLAFCPEEQQSALVAELLESTDPINSAYLEREYLDRMIAGVKAKGYAERDHAVEPKATSTIAVPILNDGRAIASVGLTYFSSAVSREEAISSHVPALKRAALQISDRVSAIGML